MSVRLSGCMSLCLVRCSCMLSVIRSLSMRCGCLSMRSCLCVYLSVSSKISCCLYICSEICSSVSPCLSAFFIVKSSLILYNCIYIRFVSLFALFLVTKSERTCVCLDSILCGWIIFSTGIYVHYQIYLTVLIQHSHVCLSIP